MPGTGEYKYQSTDDYIRDTILKNKRTKCWEWPTVQKSNGHGKAYWRGRSVQSSRLSFEAFVSDIPAGFKVVHLCGSNSCVNPDHLALQNLSQIMKRKKSR